MDSPPRNFATVTNQIINVLEYSDQDYKLGCLYKSVLTLIWLNNDNTHVLSQPHIVSKIYRGLVEWEEINLMSYADYQSFVRGIRKIQNDGIYLPPQVYHTLWEKLARLCHKYLNRYILTPWGMRISRIITNTE